jgi:hypothetical protein
MMQFASLVVVLVLLASLGTALAEGARVSWANVSCLADNRASEGRS